MGYGLWVVGYGLWVMGCGLWAEAIVPVFCKLILQIFVRLIQKNNMVWV